mmetsp:Transcript_8469/g.26104  ORF Transcript_8469/g.26104 Transcript_8469/m.26104 type:complete len:82 (-) Transcript_8469:240-485(-)
MLVNVRVQQDPVSSSSKKDCCLLFSCRRLIDQTRAVDRRCFRVYFTWTDAASVSTIHLSSGADDVISPPCPPCVRTRKPSA